MYAAYFKRILDILLVFLSFCVLFPLLLATALIIKIFDPGPIIFKQERVGRFGECFSFYKFRSMPINTGDIPSDKVGDLKLTWVGKLIRRTNIDELPQLFNILKGDMSIVGPRPPISSQSFLIQLRKDNGSINLRPGLTGLAQVNSFDGMSISDKAHFDGLYFQKCSFFTDVKIILNTVVYLFRPPPVY
tara:strand:+ start:13269 stop:13835 length:567 start_codon:yes stop_codon:yes gene_type:complete